jgi:hypothetical protein
VATKPAKIKLASFSLEGALLTRKSVRSLLRLSQSSGRGLITDPGGGGKAESDDFKLRQGTVRRIQKYLESGTEVIVLTDLPIPARRIHEILRYKGLVTSEILSVFDLGLAMSDGSMFDFVLLTRGLTRLQIRHHSGFKVIPVAIKAHKSA